ncbi:MAG: TetR family transcriptional regulator [Gammaproteobacteria bacterium]
MVGLRERKYARTRLTLCRVLLKAMEKTPYQDVSVRELCDKAEFSEATFFNYFPQKQDCLQLAIQLWLLELSSQLERSETQPGISRIQTIFNLVALHSREHPGFMLAVIHWVASGGQLSEQFAPSLLERQFNFPDDRSVDEMRVLGFDRLLGNQLQAAVSSGQLPSNTLLPTVMAGLLSLLFGMPLILLGSDPGRIGSLYQQQLQLYWSGLQAVSRG